MRRLSVGLLGAALLFAQDWKTAVSFPGVETKGLTAAQETTVLRLLRNHDCSCGCGMKVAECRLKDPQCSYSRGLASVMVETIKAGKSASDAVAAAEASRWAHLPTRKLLDDAVAIPTAGAPEMGPQDARITLVEFSDFQCPYCVKAVEQVKAILTAYPGQVKLFFKQFPLDFHSQAALAANAAIAAHHQGKFWPMHDALFANRQRLSRATMVELAGGLGLDMKRFAADLASPETKKLVDKDVDDGERAGVEGTPTFFINGQRYNGSLDLDAVRPVLDAELKRAPK